MYKPQFLYYFTAIMIEVSKSSTKYMRGRKGKHLNRYDKYIL